MTLRTISLALMHAIATNEHDSAAGARPQMETDATDGSRLRDAGIPTYGLSSVFIDVDDVRAHGRDERIMVKSFYEGLDYMYQLVREVAVAGA